MYFGGGVVMKKISFLFLICPFIVAGGVKAVFNQDLTVNSCITKNIDGTAFIAVSNDLLYDVFDETVFDENSSVTLRRGDDTLRLTAGETTAEFNSQATELPAKPFFDETYFYVPARYVCELFGMSLKYEDVRVYNYKKVRQDVVNKVTILCGEDIHTGAGLIGDKRNDWRISVPDGFVYYSDSVDSSTVTIDNLNGVSVKIELCQPTSFDVQSMSLNLEDYLIRNEAVQGDKNSFYVQGLVYSNPTPENRALLNSIIDSFIPKYEDSAVNISNSNGDTWDFKNISCGVSFDMPIQWDTYLQNGSSINAGYKYGSRIGMDSYFYKYISADEFVDGYLKYREYFGIDPELNFNETEYGGIRYLIAEALDDKSFDSRGFFVHAVTGSGGNVYHFIFSASLDAQNDEALNNAVKAELYENIDTVLSSMKFDTPRKEGKTFQMVDNNGDTKEITLNGYKFDVPSFLNIYYYSDINSYLVTGEQSRYLGYFSSLGILSYDSNTLTDESFDGFRKDDINGITVFVTEDDYLYCIPDGGIIILFNKAGKGSEEYINDLYEIINSVHK